MPPFLYALPFFLLAALGIYLLHGIALQNGLFTHISYMCSPSGTGRTLYVGWRAIDKPLCGLISFFEAAFSHPPDKTFLSLFSSLLLAPLLLIHVAASQPSQHPLITYSALPAGLGCQLFGAGVAFPLWFGLYMLVGRRRGGAPSEETGGKAYFPAFVLGFIIPAWFMMSPDRLWWLTDEGDVRSRANQEINAVWQAFPICLAILVPLLSHFFPTSKRITIISFKLYLTANYYSFLHSFYSLVSSTYGGDLIQALRETLVISPFSATNPQKAHFFLLMDFVMVYLSTGLWVMMGRREGVTLKSVGTLLYKSVLHGPGNAILGMWDVRPSK